MRTEGILAVLILGLLATTFFLGAEKPTKQFESFKARFGKVYSADEDEYRRSVFKTNLNKIQEHNADGSHTYELGITQFADMTTEEFVDKILMKKLPTPSEITTISIGGPVPNGIDWRGQGAVTAVKNQGSCGSCWSFSTTGALEGAYYIKYGVLPSYSEQQLVDCCGSKGFQCQGCNGAWPEWALNYINNAGIVLEGSYPYTGRVGTCQSTGGDKILDNPPYTILATGDTGALRTAVGRQPISVCLDASNWSLYKSGVFANCNLTPLNHAVLLIGYEDSGAWIVKNSWGTSWGESGYIRLNSGNTCGIAQHAIVVNVKWLNADNVSI